MCIKCLMKEAMAAGVASQEKSRNSGGTATGDRELNYGQQQDQAYIQVELDQARASVNITNAEAILKLSQAAQFLENINQSDAVKRVIDLIKHLIPAKPIAEPAPATTGKNNIPSEILDLVRELGLNPEDIVVTTFPKV